MAHSRFAWNADDIVIHDGRMVCRTGFGSEWVAFILGTKYVYGGMWHELTPEQLSQLEHCVRIGNVNPLTGRHNATRVSRRDYGDCYTLTLH